MSATRPPKKSGRNTHDTLLDLFKTTGVYARKVRYVDAEKKITQANARALKAQKISDTVALKHRLESKQLIPGFQLRPSTLIKENIPIKTFEFGSRITIFINPQSPAVYASHFYKRNVVSADIASHRFNFSRPCGAKKLDSPIGLLTKIEEQDKRRRGEEYDNKNKWYGKGTIRHNEILLHYGFEAVLGFGVSNYSQAKTLLNYNKNVHLYCYCVTGTLHRIFPADLQAMLDEVPKGQFDFGSHWSRDTLEHVEETSCSLSTTEPSKEHPITYFFQSKHRQGQLYFEKNGSAFLKIGKRKHLASCGDIELIQETHQENRFQQCNAILGKEHIKKRLNVKSIKINLDSDLILEYRNFPHQGIAPEVILNQIGYDLNKGWKWKESSESSKTKKSLLLYVHQSADAIFNRLNRLNEEYNLEETEERAPKKRRIA